MANKQTFRVLFLLLYGLGFAATTVQAQEENQKHGSFTDPRDGYTYRTVELADQVWMAENLRHASKDTSCYYDWDKKNEQIYGRLYAWETAQHVCPTGWHLPSLEEWIDLVNIFGENYDYDGQLLITKNKKKLSKEEKKKGKQLIYDTWQSFQVGGTTGFDVLLGGECKNLYGAYDWRSGGRPVELRCDMLEGWARFWSTGTKLRNFLYRENAADIMKFFKGRKGKGVFVPSPGPKGIFSSVRCVMDKPVPLDVEK